MHFYRTYKFKENIYGSLRWRSTIWLDVREINITVGILSRVLVDSLLSMPYVSIPSFLSAINCLSHIQAHVECVSNVCTDAAWCPLKKSLNIRIDKLKTNRKSNLNDSNRSIYADTDWNKNWNYRKSISDCIKVICNRYTSDM